MYYILERELTLKGITRKQLSIAIGLGTTAITEKLRGKRNFTLEECKKVKEFLQFDGTIDELFRTD